MESSRRLARSVALASFLGTALIGGAALEIGYPEEAEAGHDIDESYFYSSLAPHGSWVQNAQFGWVWYPNHRPRNWRPYTVGRWVWTDYGEWMWVSDEPYGWATYHYGRWFLDPFFGWVWLPGRVWAPAWVSWRDCDDYVGWAPLSPWGYYDRHNRRYRDWDRWNNNHHDNDDDRYHGSHGGYGNGHGGYRNDRDDQDDWTFTRKRDFGNSRVDRVMLDRHHQADVYRRSRDLPPPSEQDERQGRGVARGIDRGVIEKASGRPIRPVKLEDDNAPPGAGGHGGAQRGGDREDRVRVFRPKISERKPDAPTPDRLGIAKPIGKRPDRPSGEDRSGNPHGRDQSDLRDRTQDRSQDRSQDRQGMDRNPQARPKDARDRNAPGSGGSDKTDTPTADRHHQATSPRDDSRDRQSRPTDKSRDDNGSVRESRPSGRSEPSPVRGGPSHDPTYGKSGDTRSPEPREPRGSADKPRGGRYEVPTANQRQEQGKNGASGSERHSSGAERQPVERSNPPRSQGDSRHGGSYSSPRQSAPSVDRTPSAPPSPRTSDRTLQGGGSTGGGRETMHGGGSTGGGREGKYSASDSGGGREATRGGGNPGGGRETMHGGGGGGGSPQGRGASPSSGGSSGAHSGGSSGGGQGHGGHGGQGSQGGSAGAGPGSPYSGPPPVGR